MTSSFATLINHWKIALAACSILLITTNGLKADTIDFEDLSLATDSFFDGYGSGASTGTWQSGDAIFNTNQFGPGWSYSNVDDTTTSGFTNQWAAFTGSGFGGSGNYAMANTFSSNGAFINLPTNQSLVDVQVTNSTYAGLSMRDGDAFAKKFGGASGDDPDYFVATFTGFSELDKAGIETGSVDFFLGDYRFSDNTLDYIVDQWTTVDLTGLGAAKSIGISFDGSDIGQFGLNTPVYVAIDNLRFESIPEPTCSLILVFCGFGLASKRRRQPS